MLKFGNISDDNYTKYPINVDVCICIDGSADLRGGGAKIRYSIV